MSAAEIALRGVGFSHGPHPVLADITAIRAREMEHARQLLGVRQVFLGYVDSGLPEGDPLPPLPDGCFAVGDLEEQTRALVEVVRRERPHVMTTYDETGGYPHPDHIRCHEVSVAAFEAAGDPERFPEAAIEDVELGMRLRRTGAAIVLDPEVRGTHLKRWSLRSSKGGSLVQPWIACLKSRCRSRLRCGGSATS